jgi:hypothetical protein
VNWDSRSGDEKYFTSREEDLDGEWYSRVYESNSQPQPMGAVKTGTVGPGAVATTPLTAPKEGKADGKWCSSNDQCKSGRCSKLHCVHEFKDGEACKQDIECESKHCHNSMMTCQKYPYGGGVGCTLDLECASKVCFEKKLCLAGASSNGLVFLFGLAFIPLMNLIIF